MSLNVQYFQIGITTFSRLKRPVFYLVLEHFQESEVADKQISQIKWVEKAFKLCVETLSATLQTLELSMRMKKDLSQFP
jgi:23S rRNA C2498 (ribose-2'-O)-methylase RlmM